MRDESCVTNDVATNKPHIQAYIDADIHAQLMEYKEQKGCSKSEAIESLLKIYLGLDKKTVEILEKWSTKDRRPVEQQAQVILEDAAEDWAKRNMKFD